MRMIDGDAHFIEPLDLFERYIDPAYRERAMQLQRDPATGHLQKRIYGPWMLTAFRLLARLRFLRGTTFDIFGRTAERRAERRLVAEYEALVDQVTAALSPANHAAAVELAALPLEIRGFGHVKEKNLQRAKAKEADLLARFRSPPPQVLAAE